MRADARAEAPGRAEHGRYLRALAAAVEDGLDTDARLTPWEVLSRAERRAWVCVAGARRGQSAETPTDWETLRDGEFSARVM